MKKKIIYDILQQQGYYGQMLGETSSSQSQTPEI